MAEPNWKKSERRIAAVLGGQRVPVTGRARGDVPDIAHHWLSVEVKTRQQLPKWLKEALAQAKAAATKAQLPLVVLHESGKHHGSDIVMMALDDFQAWFGGLDDG